MNPRCKEYGCTYSRAMNQVLPRRCVYCSKAEGTADQVLPPPFSITVGDVGRYVRRISTGEVGFIQQDPGNKWLHPEMKYEWKHCPEDFEYVTVTKEIKCHTT